MRGSIKFRQRVFNALLVLLTILGSGCARDLGVKPRDPWHSAQVAAPGSTETAWRPGVLSPESRGILIAAGWNGATETLVPAMRPLAASPDIRTDPVRARAVTEGCLLLARRAIRDHQDARGLLLCALRTADPFVTRSPSSRRSCADFVLAENFCVSRLAAVLGSRLDDVARSSSIIAGPFEAYNVKIVRGSGDGGVAPGSFEDLEACDEHQIVHAAVITKLGGAGTPLLGRVKGFELTRRRNGMQPLEGFVWPVTVTVEFSATQNGVCHATFALYDPRLAESIRLHDRATPLAADYTTPIAFTATSQRRAGLGLAGLLHGEKYFGAAGLYPTLPYAPKKIPVILIHGLLSDHDTWAYLLNAIYADKTIRRDYQFWVYYYPTSLPVPYSALVLREQFERIRARTPGYDTNPAFQRTVLIGHSMGGLLARFVVSDSGNALYREYFRVPIEKLNLMPALRDKLQEGMYFKPLPGITGVVFIATPHRGSSLAANPIARWVRQFVKLPTAPKDELSEVFVTNRAATVRNIGVRDSLDSLRPDNEIYRALPNMPIPARVRLHSIIGNRGDGRSVGSSDGVVPYSSSHLAGVDSELLVPAGHSGTLKRPETAQEVVRILKENERRHPSNAGAARRAQGRGRERLNQRQEL